MITVDDGDISGKGKPKGGTHHPHVGAQHMQQYPEKKRVTTLEDTWDIQQLVLTCLCHFQTVQELPNIWEDIAPLKKEKARTTLEIA